MNAFELVSACRERGIVLWTVGSRLLAWSPCDWQVRGVDFRSVG